MATYKLIQDIEAEDHILGPLSFRQFVFALIAVFLLYLNFLVVVKHVPFLLIIFLPPALFFLFFALPFGRDQPTEIWALAKLRFLFKPRKRIWDQSGMKELVTITVPKKIEHYYTDGLSQREVKSRLSALASTLDSRGWALKNVSGDSEPEIVTSSDRLVGLNSVPQEVPTIDVREADDILDQNNNPVAQQFSTMIDASTQAHRQAIIDEMNKIRTDAETQLKPPVAAEATSPWFISPPPSPVAQQTAAAPNQAEVGEPSPNELALAASLKSQNDAQQAAYSHMRTVQPAPVTMQPPQPPQPAVTATPDPAILNLANNNDLNVSTLAREAKKARNGGHENTDEVVVSLH